MKSSIVAVLLLFLCGVATVTAQGGITYNTVLSFGTKLPSNWDVTNVPWGLSLTLKIQPQFSDLLSNNATNTNNTDLVYSLSSYPGVLEWSPSNVTFRVTVPSSVIDGTIDAADEVVFTPSFQLARFTPVFMGAVPYDPQWAFNMTSDNIIIPSNFDVTFGWKEDCYLAGTTTPCTSMTSFARNDTSFCTVIPRSLSWEFTGEVTVHNAGTAADYYAANAPLEGVVPYLPTKNFFVFFPLTGSSPASGSSTGQAQAFQLPGRENAGGSLSISIFSVWRSYDFNDTFTVLEQVDPAPVTMFPSVVTINEATPVGMFLFTQDTPWSVTAGGSDYLITSYYIFFRVNESSASPSVDNSIGFPQGAYAMAPTRLVVNRIDFRFLDLNVFSALYIPISPRKTGSYRYHVLVEYSPQEMGMGPDGTIVYPFQISPPGAFRILVASNASDSSFVPADSFVWTGAQRVIEFILDTQDTVSDPAMVNWTFSDPVFTPARAVDAFNLLEERYFFQIMANPLFVTVTNDNGDGRIEDGILPGQPFAMLFEWSPPTTSGFEITVEALGITYPDGTSGGSYTFSVGAGQTAYLAGSFVAAVPTNLGGSFDEDTIIPVLVSLDSLTGGATADDGWYYVNSPVPVRISRDRVYVLSSPVHLDFSDPSLKRASVNFDDGEFRVLPLSMTGAPSEPICIGVSLNSHFFSNDQQEVWVTLYSETIDITENPFEQWQNRSGLLFTALDVPAAAPGVSRAGMPPGTVVLSKANTGTGCFVTAFDHNWAEPRDYAGYLQSVFDALDAVGYEGDVFDRMYGMWRVMVAIGGPSSGMIFEQPAAFYVTDLLRLPEVFLVRRPDFQFTIFSDAPQLPSEDFSVYAGDSIFIYVSLTEPTLRGVNYILLLPYATITEVNVTQFNGKAGFAPGSIGPHIWSATFNRIRAEDDFDTALETYVYGPDGNFFGNNLQEPVIHVASRTVVLHVVSDSVPVGYPAGPYPVALSVPVKNDLTLTPYSLTNPTNALIFDPPQFVFTPGSVLSPFFTVRANEEVLPYALGTFSWKWRLSGSDANITYFAEEQTQSVTWERRPTPRFLVDFPTNLYAGVTYGPYDISLEVPLLPGEDPLVVAPTASDLKLIFDPPSVTFLPGEFQHVVLMRFEPDEDQGNMYNGVSVKFEMSGPSAWRYTPHGSGVTVSTSSLIPRDYWFKYDDDVVMGVNYTGSIHLEMETPNSVSFDLVSDSAVFDPPSVIFVAGGGVVKHFTYSVPNFVLYPSKLSKVTLFFEHVSGPDARYYNQEEKTRIFSVTRQSFNFEPLRNIELGNEAVFVLNRPSQLYTVHVTAAPRTSVTLNLVSQFLVFTPSALTFTPGVLTQSFYFTPVLIPATEMVTQIFNGVTPTVTGTDAAYFSSPDQIFEEITIIPEIEISPIAPIYTDGHSEQDIIVNLKSFGRFAAANPSGVQSMNSFTLQIEPSADNIYVEPSTLEFSAADTSALKTFSITHVSPSRFEGAKNYEMKYFLKPNGYGAERIEVTNYMPKHARHVILKRYNIVPTFPKVLSYGWQEASFNLTRVCGAHVALKPILPLADGWKDSLTSQPYGGHAVPGGRVEFDPAVIVFAPGQLVQTFSVKADRSIAAGAEALYYRVDWEIVAHPDDAENFIEFVAVRSYNGHFSTWHVAGATLTQLSVSLILLLPITLLLLSL